MWQPDQNLVLKVTDLITETFSGISNIRQSQIANEVANLSMNPEFTCALICILNQKSLPITIRLAAGHSLKSTLEKGVDFTIEQLRFLQEGVIHGLDDLEISKAVSNIATTLYITQDGWPQLLAILTERIENIWAQEMLLSLFEDISTYSLLSELLNTPDYSLILKEMVMRLMILTENSFNQAARCMNQLVQIMPSTVIPSLSKYLDLLIRMNSSADKDIKQPIAEGITSICTNRKDLILARFPECATIMLDGLTNGNSHTKTALRFWTEIGCVKDVVLPYLSRLLSFSIDNLKVKQEDIMDMLPENDEFRFDDYEEENMNWTVRRESAILIDFLANNFGTSVFGLVQEKIQTLMLSTN